MDWVTFWIGFVVGAMVVNKMRDEKDEAFWVKKSYEDGFSHGFDEGTATMSASGPKNLPDNVVRLRD